jgi:formylglycine-generating enzyme required for sulfatase activity
MVWIPGGEFSMGAQDPPEHDEVGMLATRDARPIHRVYVEGEVSSGANHLGFRCVKDVR